MKAEAEGIFLWAFEGLQRLIKHNFQFTESERTRSNRDYSRRDANNIIDFMGSEGYIRLRADYSIISKELYGIYKMWCEENALPPLKPRSFSDFLIEHQKEYNLEHNNRVTNAAGRRVWGFEGIEALAKPNINENMGDSLCTYIQD